MVFCWGGYKGAGYSPKFNMESENHDFQKALSVKTNILNSKNEALEDDVPFQRADFQVPVAGFQVPC